MTFCRFCGSELNETKKYYNKDIGATRHYVRCSTCGAKGPEGVSSEEAQIYWVSDEIVEYLLEQRIKKDSGTRRKIFTKNLFLFIKVWAAVTLLYLVIV